MSSWASWGADDVAQALSTIEVPWWFAGGWALDLFVGSSVREHRDVDVSVFREDFEAFAASLDGWESFAAAGGRLELWQTGEPMPEAVHSYWLRPSGSARWHFEILLEERENGEWLYRRDRSIRRPLAELVYERRGRRFVRPEIQLLYKAKETRAEDRADFDHVVAHLSSQSGAWLTHALERLHPGHTWLAILDASGSG